VVANVEQTHNVKNYHVDEQKKLESANGQAEIRELCRKNLIVDGKLPQI
jgi:hypothetical protein